LLCVESPPTPLRRLNVGKGHKVGVLGLGGLGHMAVKFAASFGAVTMLPFAIERGRC
jgi:D-arabinose 1-dehydrogenase-like Zn-dependent alcohol dehydrogenase